MYREQLLLIRESLLRATADSIEKVQGKEVRRKEECLLDSIVIPSLYLGEDDIRRIALQVYVYWTMAHPVVQTAGLVVSEHAALETTVEQEIGLQIPALEIIRQSALSAGPDRTAAAEALKRFTAAVQTPPQRAAGSSSVSVTSPRPIIAADGLLHVTHVSVQQGSQSVRQALSLNNVELDQCRRSLELFFFSKFIHETIHCITPLLMHDINSRIQASFSHFSGEVQTLLNQRLGGLFIGLTTPGKKRPVYLTGRKGKSRRVYDKPETTRMTECLLFGGEVLGIPYANRTPGHRYYFNGLTVLPPPLSQLRKGAKAFRLTFQSLVEAQCRILFDLPSGRLGNWDLSRFDLSRFRERQRVIRQVQQPAKKRSKKKHGDGEEEGDEEDEDEVESEEDSDSEALEQYEMYRIAHNELESARAGVEKWTAVKRRMNSSKSCNRRRVA